MQLVCEPPLLWSFQADWSPAGFSPAKPADPCGLGGSELNWFFFSAGLLAQRIFCGRRDPGLLAYRISFAIPLLLQRCRSTVSSSYPSVNTLAVWGRVLLLSCSTRPCSMCAAM
jgi:hypothetical protein